MSLNYSAKFSSLNQGWSWKSCHFSGPGDLFIWGSFPFSGVAWHKPGHLVELAGSSCCLSNGVSEGCADVLPASVGLVEEGVTADLGSLVPPLLRPCSRRGLRLLVFLTQFPATKLLPMKGPADMLSLPEKRGWFQRFVWKAETWHVYD